MTTNPTNPNNIQGDAARYLQELGHNVTLSAAGQPDSSYFRAGADDLSGCAPAYVAAGSVDDFRDEA